MAVIVWILWNWQFEDVCIQIYIKTSKLSRFSSGFS